jgi:hypothetical protein
MTSRQFHDVTRRDAYATFLDGRIELGEGPPSARLSLLCGVYTIDGRSILVVNEPLSASEHALLAKENVPGWADCLVGASLLSGGVEAPLWIDVDVCVPADSDRAAAAFAAACALLDVRSHDANPVACLVRVLEHVLHVKASIRGGRWSGTVDDASEEERHVMSRWRFYRSLDTRFAVDADWGWAGWDGQAFRRFTHPYELVGSVPFDVVPIDGREIAVIHSPVTPEQRAQLTVTARPSWIDVVVTTSVTNADAAENVGIEVDSIEPADVDPAMIAAAVATAYRSHAILDGERTQCIVSVMNETLQVSVELEYGDPDDGLPPSFAVRTSPVK